VRRGVGHLRSGRANSALAITKNQGTGGAAVLAVREEQRGAPHVRGDRREDVTQHAILVQGRAGEDDPLDLARVGEPGADQADILSHESEDRSSEVLGFLSAGSPVDQTQLAERGGGEISGQTDFAGAIDVGYDQIDPAPVAS